ncbi:recombinase family protein [Shinella sp. S4-D37]|uniref:recombinase family protein n=1 Tax=Shinella sp. S4-D37 TaxID=3161999 RepID=UPI003464E90A
MTRVAIYARYSSDNQSEASIEDQFRICREQAKRDRWRMVGTYKDAGISGISMILRSGIQSLLQDAQTGQFDVVLAEGWTVSRATRPTWRPRSSISSSPAFRSLRWLKGKSANCMPASRAR